MFILYSDFSGAPELSDTTSVIALSGICIHEGIWYALDRRVNALKARYEFPGVPMELHAKDFCVSFSEQDDIASFAQLDLGARRSAVLSAQSSRIDALQGARREDYRRKCRGRDPYIHLTRQERSRLYEDALDLIGSHDGIRLFGEAVDKIHLSSVRGSEYDPINHSVTQVISRFEYFLENHNSSDRMSREQWPMGS